MTKDSDIDLLIVAPNPYRTGTKSAFGIADAIGDIEYSVDVIMIAPERSSHQGYHRRNRLSGHK